MNEDPLTYLNILATTCANKTEFSLEDFGHLSAILKGVWSNIKNFVYESNRTDILTYCDLLVTRYGNIFESQDYPENPAQTIQNKLPGLLQRLNEYQSKNSKQLGDRCEQAKAEVVEKIEQFLQMQKQCETIATTHKKPPEIPKYLDEIKYQAYLLKCDFADFTNLSKELSEFQQEVISANNKLTRAYRALVTFLDAKREEEKIEVVTPFWQTGADGEGADAEAKNSLKP